MHTESISVDHTGGVRHLHEGGPNISRVFHHKVNRRRRWIVSEGAYIPKPSSRSLCVGINVVAFGQKDWATIGIALNSRNRNGVSNFNARKALAST
jgi:hypothetical protein